jgi:hypothetical protein
MQRYKRNKHKELEAKISAWFGLKPDPALMAGTTAIKINKTSQTSARITVQFKTPRFCSLIYYILEDTYIVQFFRLATSKIRLSCMSKYL